MLYDECPGAGRASRATANKITVVFAAETDKFDGTYASPKRLR
jgi:hypothetical protein